MIDEIEGRIAGLVEPRAHGENGIVAVCVKPDEIETDSFLANIKQAAPDLKDIRIIKLDEKAAVNKRKERMEKGLQILNS